MAEALKCMTVVDAEAALEALLENSRSRQRIEEQYAQMVERYDLWKQGMLRVIDEDDAQIRARLKEWYDQQPEKEKGKAVPLPCGKVGYKRPAQVYMMGGAKVDKDNKDLLNFVKSGYDAYVKTKKVESVDWQAFKKTVTVLEDGQAVTEEGEVIPGMKVTTYEPEFFADVKEG